MTYPYAPAPEPKRATAGLIIALVFAALFAGCGLTAAFLTRDSGESAASVSGAPAIQLVTDPVSPSPSASVSPAPVAKPISIAQANANRAAESYLSSQAFSRKGLIDHLKYEGFSTKVATTAVDSLHADWREQAALAAAAYLRSQSFSRKGLIEQLEYEGFSHSDAVHGVSTTGL